MLTAAAFTVTAAILGFTADAVGNVPPIYALLIGVFGAALPVGVAAWFGRKKNEVDVSKAITDAAAELLSQYRQRDMELEARLVTAERAATSALLAEAECRQRLGALEETVRGLAPQPNATTTTTVQVTHP